MSICFQFATSLSLKMHKVLKFQICDFLHVVFWNSLLGSSCHYYPWNLPVLGAKRKRGSAILQVWAAEIPQVGSWNTPVSRYKEAGAWLAWPVPEPSDLPGWGYLTLGCTASPE